MMEVTDRTSEIVASYQAKYNNIVALSKTNGGKASAQNYGLRVSRRQIYPGC